MAKRSGSKTKQNAEIDAMVARLRKDAAPAVAKALNLDSAEAVEAALNAAVEMVLAARAVVRAMPLPPEAVAHLDRAEAEALRATRMAVRGMEGAAGRGKAAGAKRVSVEFERDRSGKQRGEKSRRPR